MQIRQSAGWSSFSVRTSGCEDVAVVRYAFLIAVLARLSGENPPEPWPPPRSETSFPLARGKVAKQPPLLLAAVFSDPSNLDGNKEGGKKIKRGGGCFPDDLPSEEPRFSALGERNRGVDAPQREAKWRGGKRQYSTSSRDGVMVEWGGGEALFVEN